MVQHDRFLLPSSPDERDAAGHGTRRNRTPGWRVMPSYDEKGRRVTTPEELLARINAKYGFCRLHGEPCQRIDRECWPEEIRAQIPEKPLPLTKEQEAYAEQVVARLAKESGDG